MPIHTVLTCVPTALTAVSDSTMTARGVMDALQYGHVRDQLSMQHLSDGNAGIRSRRRKKKTRKHQGDVWSLSGKTGAVEHCQCQKHAWTGLYGSLPLTVHPRPRLHIYNKGAPLPQESTVINASCLITQRIWVIWKGPIYMVAFQLDRNPVFRAGQRFKYRLLSKINSRLYTTEASVTAQARLFVWGLST